MLQASIQASFHWSARRMAANAFVGYSQRDAHEAQETTMPQTSSRIFDDLAKLMSDAAGAADGMRREVEGVMRAQGERVMGAMDLVQREEFEAVKAMAIKAREENEKLAARLATLETEIARLRS